MCLRSILLGLLLFVPSIAAMATSNSDAKHMTGQGKITFLIELSTARPKLFARVMQVLGTTCHQLVENVPCRRFEVFDSESEVKGRFPAHDGVFLIRVREKERSAGGQAQFAIAMLHRPHGKLIAFANPGEFRFPSDHQLAQGDRDNSEVRVAQDLAKTLLNLAFK